MNFLSNNIHQLQGGQNHGKELITYLFAHRNLINPLLDDFVVHRDYDKTQLKLALHIGFIDLGLMFKNYPFGQDLVHKLLVTETLTDLQIKELYGELINLVDYEMEKDDPLIPEYLKVIIVKMIDDIDNMIKKVIDEKLTDDGIKDDHDEKPFQVSI